MVVCMIILYLLPHSVTTHYPYLSTSSLPTPSRQIRDRTTSRQIRDRGEVLIPTVEGERACLRVDLAWYSTRSHATAAASTRFFVLRESACEFILREDGVSIVPPVHSPPSSRRWTGGTLARSESNARVCKSHSGILSTYIAWRWEYVIVVRSCLLEVRSCFITTVWTLPQCLSPNAFRHRKRGSFTTPSIERTWRIDVDVEFSLQRDLSFVAHIYFQT